MNNIRKQLRELVFQRAKAARAFQGRFIMREWLESCLKSGCLLSIILPFFLTIAQLNADIFTVTTANDDGPGSLREAIDLANNVLPSGTLNTIKFSIGGTITPLTDLPAIVNNPLFIDGYSAPGAKPNTNSIHDSNNAVIMVEIMGPGPGYMLPGPINGLQLGAGSDGSTITGLAIGNFALVPGESVNGGAGILITSQNNTIAGCFIGTDTSGNLSHPCFNAICTLNNSNQIGGSNPQSRNLLSGQYGCITNQNLGVILNFGSFTIIEGNTVGLDRAGTSVLMPEEGFGIVTINSEGTNIVNNVISGNSTANVIIQYSDEVVISNNYIGTDVFGTRAMGYNGRGIILLDSPINGPTSISLDGNLISGNSFGIQVGASFRSVLPYYGVKITNNLIGVDYSGSQSLPNTLDGIAVRFAVNTYIANNTISANGRDGIRLGKSRGALIRSNFIGTDSSKTLALGNKGDGIRLGTTGIDIQASCDVIGGALPGEGNFISYNEGNGISTLSYVENEVIIGNTLSDNKKNGILLGPLSRRNSIGIFQMRGSNQMIGELASQKNTNLGPIGTSNLIFHNGRDGIKVEKSDENTIQTNIIDNNGGSGIAFVHAKDNVVGSSFKGSSTIAPTLANVITRNGGYGILEINNSRQSLNEILFNIINENALGSIKAKRKECK